MDLLKKITINDTFWDTYQYQCDQIMRHFDVREDESMNETYENFKEMLHFSLGETLNKHKPTLTTLTSRLKTTPAIAQLRIKKNNLYRLMKQYTNPETKKLILDEIYTINNALKKRIRQERDTFQKEKMTEIEDLQRTDCRRMWQELKRMAGWTSKSKEKEIQGVLDDKQEEVFDEDAVKVWKNSFKN